MKLQFKSESLCNLFRMKLMLPRENVKSFTLSFAKRSQRVNVLMDIAAISDDEISRHFDNLMKKTLTLKTTTKTKAPKGNVFKFRAECFSDIKQWLIAVPKHTIHSITLFFNPEFGTVEVLVYMAEYITLNNMRDYLHWIEDGHVMWESVQRPQHYTGERTSFFDAICHPNIRN